MPPTIDRGDVAPKPPTKPAIPRAIQTVARMVLAGCLMARGTPLAVAKTSLA